MQEQRSHQAVEYEGKIESSGESRADDVHHNSFLQSRTFCVRGAGMDALEELWSGEEEDRSNDFNSTSGGSKMRNSPPGLKSLMKLT